MRNPVIGISDDCTRYVVHTGFWADHDLLPQPRGLWVPPGFEFDGASVPRWFWRILPPGRPWILRGACVHDYLCEHELGKAYDAALVLRDIIAVDGKLAGEPEVLVAAVFEAVSNFGPQFGNQTCQKPRRRPVDGR